MLALSGTPRLAQSLRSIFFCSPEWDRFLNRIAARMLYLHSGVMELIISIVPLDDVSLVMPGPLS